MDISLCFKIHISTNNPVNVILLLSCIVCWTTPFLHSIRFLSTDPPTTGSFLMSPVEVLFWWMALMVQNMNIESEIEWEPTLRLCKRHVDAKVCFAPNNTPPQHAIRQLTKHPPTVIMLWILLFSASMCIFFFRFHNSVDRLGGASPAQSPFYWLHICPSATVLLFLLTKLNSIYFERPVVEIEDIMSYNSL